MKQASLSSSIVQGGGKRRGEGSISPSEFGVLSSRRGDDTYRRTFQSLCYGCAHTGTECLIHIEEAPRDDLVVVHIESEVIDNGGRDRGSVRWAQRNLPGPLVAMRNPGLVLLSPPSYYGQLERRSRLCDQRQINRAELVYLWRT